MNNYVLEINYFVSLSFNLLNGSAFLRPRFTIFWLIVLLCEWARLLTSDAKAEEEKSQRSTPRLVLVGSSNFCSARAGRATRRSSCRFSWTQQLVHRLPMHTFTLTTRELLLALSLCWCARSTRFSRANES